MAKPRALTPYLVIRSVVLYITGFLDYARNDSKYTLEITKEKSKPKYNRLAFIMLFFNSRKDLPSKDFWEKEQSLCGRAVYYVNG